MDSEKTVEHQYSVLLDTKKRIGTAQFGVMSNFVWDDDPKRLTFLLARYKFVAKMLSGRDHVLEIGCADAFGTRLVVQEAKKVTAIDFDPLFVEDAKKNINPRWNFSVHVHDILSGPFAGTYDGAFALDVMEHIVPEQEDIFVRNVSASLSEHGVLIIGMPSLESQAYASPASRAGHVNCKTGEDLRKTLSRHFHNVFLFSMNDEVVHTGYSKMAHYLVAICCSKRSA